MQITTKLKEQIGNWWEVLQPLIEEQGGAWDKLYTFLKQESKERKKTIIPASPDVWKSLQLTDRHHVKALILLQCPYATLRNDKMIANGIPMDCSNTDPYMQPSLWHWYQALEEQYGFDPENDQRCSLQYLLEEEHVLLLNSANTVELQKPDSHTAIWEPITKWMIENVINKYICGLPIVLVGTGAQKYEKYLNPMCHHVLKVEHPAAAAYANRKWDHKNMHKFIDEVIRQNNGEAHVPRWLRKKGDPVRLPDWVVNKTVDENDTTGDLPWQK